MREATVEMFQVMEEQKTVFVFTAPQFNCRLRMALTHARVIKFQELQRMQHFARDWLESMRRAE